MKNYLKIINVDQRSIVPLYRQLADGIVKGVETGRIVRNDILPSLHELHVAFDISKGTVEKAYRLLMSQGIVGSVQGKGYYITVGGEKA